MTSNGDHTLSASTPSSSILTNARDDHSNHRSPRPASTAASPKLNKIAHNDKISNGENHVDDVANLSEAETVVLEKHHPGETKVIKAERSEEDLRSIKEESRLHSPAKNGPKPSRDEHSSVNGAKNSSEPDAKSPIPTSPSSRTTSRHTKDTSPTGSATSPVYSATSPRQPSGRGRSASTADSRKRKIRDDSHPKGLEPPRQKVKTEGAKDSRYSASPATPAQGLSHKRSQSTQSLLTNTTSRRRRDLAISTERKHWSDDSSGESSSPRRARTPFLQSHARVKRSDQHRALTSPARTMPHPRKLDKYGATQLSRESERGNIAAVKEAYEAAPEELNHADFAGFTPLQKASLHGWADVVKFLIEKGCSTDCESLNRDTPLIDAVENGHLDVVRLLLNEGRVNPHHQNKKGQRAIDVLDNEVEDAEEIEKELQTAMRRHVDTSTNDDDAQSRFSQTKTASRLLYNEYNTETLVEKAGDGDILAVGELINSNIKPNIACGVAASRGGHYDILSILLASGLKADPDPSKHSETPMLVAIGRGHLKIVKLLLEQDNFDPTRRNREGKTYYEISEDRRGPKWQEEKEILKSAFDNYKHKSPKRNRKDPSVAAAARFKRKPSPSRRERSSSPRADSKRAQSAKVSAPVQKSRRLMSGKQMANRGEANREVKRRRRVVDDESSGDDDSEDEVRAPTKKPTKPRAMSEGEEHKPVKKIKVRSEEHDVTKRAARATSHETNHDRQPKQGPKIKTRVERVSSGKHTPDPDSLDEKKSAKNKIRSRPSDDGRVKKRRASDVSVDDSRVKKAPTVSAKSTPAPPEKASTPEAVVRERKQEERKQEEKKQEERRQEEQKHAEQQAEKQAAEAKRKAAEEAAQKREEEEKETARKAAEEEVKKKAAEAEAEARRIAEEEAEMARRREAEEAKRKAEEEEAKRKAEEEEAKRREALEAQRQKELAERQHRVASLPRALRRACELGNNRPLHFSGEELGISAVFLPLFFATSEDLQLGDSTTGKIYIPSFQVAGILGFRELDLAHLDAPYSSWHRIPFTHKQRDLLLRQYDVALLAQDFRFPMEGTPDFDYAHIQESIKHARQQFMSMEGLYWVEDSVLYPEVEKVESLQPLLQEIKDVSKRRRVHLAEAESQLPEQKQKPRKSFMDTVLAKNGGA